MIYKDFEIKKHRRCHRIYKDGVFMEVSSSLVNAKRQIDFCLKHGVWK